MFIEYQLSECSKSDRFNLKFIPPIATVCNNCDTSIEYIQQHYFHYDAKRATGALATGRKDLKGRL